MGGGATLKFRFATIKQNLGWRREAVLQAQPESKLTESNIFVWTKDNIFVRRAKHPVVHVQKGKGDDMSHSEPQSPRT